MPRKESLREIDEVRNHCIIRIRPETCEFEAVARLRPARPALLILLHRIEARTVRIVLRIRPIGNHENLYILVEPCPCPERIPLIPIDLIECLADLHPAPLQLQMHQRQPVYQDRHVIAIVIGSPILLPILILMNHLQAVIMDLLFINERDILRRPVIPLQDLDIVLLDLLRLLLRMLIRVRKDVMEEIIPFPI